jgi:hypothetical protein
VMAVAPITVRSSLPVNFPNLKLTLSTADEQAWAGWHEEFVVKGLNDDIHEKKGRLVYLTPDRKDELGGIAISNVGIFRLGREEAPGQPAGAGRSEPVERLVAELYCEHMTLEV